MFFSIDVFPQVTGKEMVKVMIGHVWPAGEPQIKRRVALAGSLLVGAKVLDIFMSSSYLLCCITSLMTPIKSVII